MKKVIFIISIVLVSVLNTTAQNTIAQLDSTYKKDYTQEYLNTNPIISKVLQPDTGAFICFQINKGGNIYVPIDTNQRGSSSYARFDTKSIADSMWVSTDSLITVCKSLTGNESKTDIENIFKVFYKLQIYAEIPKPVTVEDL